MKNNLLLEYVTVVNGELLPPQFYNALHYILEVTHKKENWRTSFEYIHLQSLSSQTQFIPDDLPFLVYAVMDIRAVLCKIPTLWDEKLLAHFVESIIKLSSEGFDINIRQHFCDVLVDLYASQVQESAIYLPIIKGEDETSSWGINFQDLKKISVGLTVLPSVSEELTGRWVRYFSYFHKQYDKGGELSE